MKNIQIYNSGNPTFLIMFTSPNGGFLDGDILYSYFDYEGLLYVNGKSIKTPSTGNTILIAFMSEGSLPDGTPFTESLNGAPANTELMIACLRNGIAYKVTPGSIYINIGTELVKNKITALPITLFHLKDLTVNLNEQVTLSEIPYFAWLNAQCPSFSYNDMVIQHKAHYIGTSQTNRNDGAIFEVDIRKTNREVNIPFGNARFAKKTVFTVETGSGQYSPGKYTYFLTESDIDRGYVIIRATANRYSGCGLKSDPYREVRINFDTLPVPPRNQRMIKGPGPVTIVFVDLITTPIIDQILYEDEYVVTGLRAYGEDNKNGYRLVVGNKVDKNLTFYLQKENGTTICSGNVKSGYVRYITAYNLSNEKYSDYKKFRYTVSKYKLDETLQIK